MCAREEYINKATHKLTFDAEALGRRRVHSRINLGDVDFSLELGRQGLPRRGERFAVTTPLGELV